MNQMSNFDMLTLNNSDIPELFNFSSLYKYCLYDCKTIEELLLNIVAKEDPNITFQEIKEILIDFYNTTASDECIDIHMSAITNNTIHIDKFHTIISFIYSPYGTSYLYDIYTNI